MSQRPLLAEHSAAICLAVTGFATGGAALAVVAGSVAVLTAVGLDWLASCDRATRRAIRRSVEDALDKFGPDIPEDQIRAAKDLLRTGAEKFRFDPETMAEAVKRGDAPRMIMKDLFGDVTAQDPGTVTALKISIEAAFDAFRKHPKYRESFTQDMVKALLEDHPIEVAWRERMEEKQDAQTVMLQELLRRTDGFAGAVQSADGLTLEELHALAAAFGETALSGKPELIAFLTDKAVEYENYRAQIEHIDERTAGLGNLKAAAQAAAERLDFEEVETLLARVDEVETEIAAQTKELRADNALLRGRVEEAYRLLSAAADSFGSVDPVEPARKAILAYFAKLREHGLRYGGAAISKGLDLLDGYVNDALFKEDAWLWAAGQNARAVGLQNQGSRTGGEFGAALLAEAVAACREALRVFTEADHPVAWAKTQNNLGNMLRYQGSRTGGEVGAALLGEAVAAYRAALRVHTQVDHPVVWAMTQNNLAIALRDKGGRTGGEAGAALLAEAVGASRAVLTVHTEMDHPVAWAMTQNNLAIALADQGSRTGGEAGAALLAEAVAAFRAALRVRTEADHPVAWAMTQNNLGAAVRNQGTLTEGAEGAALLAEAVAAFRAALRVRTEADHPVAWAGTQNNLGTALRDQGSRTGGEAGAALLVEAVAAYRAALRVRTEADHPVAWAMTQNNLAIALSNQGSHTGGEAGAALLGEAVAAYCAALRVYTEADHPMDWAATMKNFALAEESFADRVGCDDPALHLRASLEAVTAALRVFDAEHTSHEFEQVTALKVQLEAKLARLEGGSN